MRKLKSIRLLGIIAAALALAAGLALTFASAGCDVSIIGGRLTTVTTYQLSYDGSGGTLSGGIPAGSIEYGATVTLPTSGTRDGYTLKDFTLGGTLTGTKEPGETFTMPAGDVTITANWTTLDLTFTDSAAFDITGTVDTAIREIDVSSGVSGGEKPYTFEAEDLPPKLEIDQGSGVISGTISDDAPESGEATITVKDKMGKTAKIKIPYTIKPKPVEPVGSDITFTNNTAFDITGTVNTAIREIDVSSGVSGGEKPYTYSASGLPAGISIDAATGIISGTPSTAGSGSAAITVRDSAGATKSITISYNIAAVIITYTLTYNTNGGTLSGGTPAGSIGYGAMVTLPSSGTRDGYTLKDFTLSGAITSTKNPGETFTMPADNVTVTANWTAVTLYTVTYNTNGGIGTTPSSQSVTACSSITLASGNGLSKSGYAFAGWNTKTDGTGTNYQAEALFTPTASITLYAKWSLNSCQLSYNANGGTLSGGTPAGSIKYGATVTLPSSGTKTGYTLKDFTLSGAITSTKNPGETFTMPAGNVTVTANWTLVPYQLSYNANGGTLSGGTAAGNIEYGATVTLPTSGTKTGCTLTYFTLSGTLIDTKKPGETFTMPAGNVTVTAIWTHSTYQLSYNNNDGTLSGGTTAGNIEYGKTVTLPASGTRTGYTLKDFTLSGTLTDTKNPGETFTMPAGNVTVTANWISVPLYTVEYNINGGTGTTPPLQKIAGDSSDILASSDGFSKTNFTFTSWNTKSDGIGTDYKAGASFTPTANIILYAKWTINSYQLNYIDNDAALYGGTPASNIKYGDTVTLPTSGSKAYYTLVNLTLSGALTGTKNPGETFTMPAGNVTVTANWTPLMDTYTCAVKFNVKNGGRGLRGSDGILVSPDGSTAVKDSDSFASDFTITISFSYPAISFPEYLIVYWSGNEFGWKEKYLFLKAKMRLSHNVSKYEILIDFNGGEDVSTQDLYDVVANKSSELRNEYNAIYSWAAQDRD